MSVQEINRIDFMSLDDKTNIWWMNMTEERPWPELAPGFSDLKAKVNTYIGVAQSDDLPKHHPESKGKIIGICLYCRSEPPDDVRHLLSLIKAGCHHFKLQFRVIILDGQNNREIPIEMGQISGVRQVAPVTKPWWKIW